MKWCSRWMACWWTPGRRASHSPCGRPFHLLATLSKITRHTLIRCSSQPFGDSADGGPPLRAPTDGRCHRRVPLNVSRETSTNIRRCLGTHLILTPQVAASVEGLPAEPLPTRPERRDVRRTQLSRFSFNRFSRHSVGSSRSSALPNRNTCPPHSQRHGHSPDRRRSPTRASLITRTHRWQATLSAPLLDSGTTSTMSRPPVTTAH